MASVAGPARDSGGEMNMPAVSASSSAACWWRARRNSTNLPCVTAICCFGAYSMQMDWWFLDVACAKCFSRFSEPGQASLCCCTTAAPSDDKTGARCKKPLIFNWRLLKIYYDHSNMWPLPHRRRNHSSRRHQVPISVCSDLRFDKGIVFFFFLFYPWWQTYGWQKLQKPQPGWLASQKLFVC